MARDTLRADLGFGDELAQFDPDKWVAAPKQAPQAQERRHTRQSAEALGFSSREIPAAPPEPPKEMPVRRRRTGRNQQFNLKARPDIIEAYCRIADDNGWGLGETLEHAVALLEARYGRG
ncbi:hypothetical protein [Jannaschia sp. 2305UL9-9]|uniref:hypothetical protein n=1 Tax=Jannaschia sp. 2305UL9-9 TaxID=3121638 RepID=UPI0035298681